MTIPVKSSLLVNATGEPVWVMVDGSPVRLLECSPPELIGCPPSEPEGSLLIRPFEDSRDGVVELGVWRQSVPIYTTDWVPPVEEDVLFLVTEESFAQFPYRPDFVCPAAYRVVFQKSKKKGGKKKGKKKSKKKTSLLTVLSHVTYEPQLVIWKEEDLPPSLHAAIEEAEAGLVQGESFTSDEASTEDTEARLAADYDFFYGPGEYVVGSSIVDTVFPEEGNAVEETATVPETPVGVPTEEESVSDSPAPTGWVKGTGYVDAEGNSVTVEERKRLEESASTVQYLLYGEKRNVNGETEDDENHPT